METSTRGNGETDEMVAGNYIGHRPDRHNDRGHTSGRHHIDGRATRSAARRPRMENVISGGPGAINIQYSAATGNQIEGTDIGTKCERHRAFVDGIISHIGGAIRIRAEGNTIGGKGRRGRQPGSRARDRNRHRGRCRHERQSRRRQLDRLQPDRNGRRSARGGRNHDKGSKRTRSAVPSRCGPQRPADRRHLGPGRGPGQPRWRGISAASTSRARSSWSATSRIEVDGSNNTIGGTTRGPPTWWRVGSGTGAVSSGSNPTANLVEGNLIGTDITGTFRSARGLRPVYHGGRTNNTIGGTTPVRQRTFRQRLRPVDLETRPVIWSRVTRSAPTSQERIVPNFNGIS